MMKNRITPIYKPTPDPEPEETLQTPEPLSPGHLDDQEADHGNNDQQSENLEPSVHYELHDYEFARDRARR